MIEIENSCGAELSGSTGSVRPLQFVFPPSGRVVVGRSFVPSALTKNPHTLSNCLCKADDFFSLKFGTDTHRERDGS